jgi:hypothetical protein
MTDIERLHEIERLAAESERLGVVEAADLLREEWWKLWRQMGSPELAVTQPAAAELTAPAESGQYPSRSE